MATLINQDNVGNTYLNYINPAFTGGEPITAYSANWLTSFLTTAYGNDRNRWTASTTTGVYNMRFPVAWETITGAIATTAAGSLTVGTRFQLSNRQDGYLINSTNANTAVLATGFNVSGTAAASNSYSFAVCNNNSIAIATFSGYNRDGVVGFKYYGWLKNGSYTGSNYPRNFISMARQDGAMSNLLVAKRVATENAITAADLLQANPTLNCSISTPGANATDVIIRDNASPNNFIGIAWNLMMLPATAVIGGVYKNTGVDPDGSNQSFWLCVANWGSNKLGMRVWTENVV